MLVEFQKLRSPEELVKFLINQPPYSDPSHNLASITHRQNLIKAWGIPSRATVLEIGCGQGDFTVPLADAVGPSGHVIALDSAPLDYGTPTLRDAQAHIKASPVGFQIQFVQADGASYLQQRDQQSPVFDYIILAHSVWYLASPTSLRDILFAARGKAKQVLIAEFGMSSSRPEGVPHVLTALAINGVESFLDANTSKRNLRCGFTPHQIVNRAAVPAGWRLCDEQRAIRSPDGERYGWREITMLLKRDQFPKDVERLLADGVISVKTKSMLFGMRDAAQDSVDKLDGGMDAVVNMDVWAGRFRLGTT